MGPWKGIRYGTDQPLEVYNLDTDPLESTDVAADHPELVADLAAFLDANHIPSPHWPVD